jgi:hypothetical protein
MTIKFDRKDESEQIYTAKFLSLANRNGIPVRYETDRAKLDLGLHLTAPLDSRFKSVTANRVWFQFKGKQDGPNGLTKEKFDKAAHIAQAVQVEDFRQWFRYAEPVYLTVYVESVDKFFSIDIGRYVDQRWGDSVFKDETFRDESGRGHDWTTIHIPKTCEVNQSFWDGLSSHRSMRIDGASYQGQPLAHSHDPQSRIPQIMEPNLFDDVVGSLLVAHDYRIEAFGDAYTFYPEAKSAGDIVSISIGKMFQPYQYDLYLTREIGADADGFREDGKVFRVQGRCAVIIHSSVRTRPDRKLLRVLAEALAADGIKNVLVFVNHYMTGVGKIDGKAAFNCFPEYTQAFGAVGIRCVPQHLEDLGKNISLATNVYLCFRETIPWLDEALERKIKTGEFTVLSPKES